MTDGCCKSRKELLMRKIDAVNAMKKLPRFRTMQEWLDDIEQGRARVFPKLADDAEEGERDG